MTEYPDIEVGSTERPFKLIRFSSQREGAIRSFMEDIGYDGPTYWTDGDMLTPSEFGFDLVKHQTDGLFPLSKAALRAP